MARARRRDPRTGGILRYVDGPKGSSVMLAAALPRSDAVEVGLRAGRWTYAAPLR